MDKYEIIIKGEEIPKELPELLKKNGYAVTMEENATAGDCYYRVRILADSLNVRKAPTVNSPRVTYVKRGEVYTIVKDLGSWGKLKSGAGYISLSPKYVERI